MPKQPPPLLGWGQIAQRLELVLQLPVSSDLARWYSRRAVDPLPVRRWGRKIVAEVAVVEAWAARWKGT